MLSPSSLYCTESIQKIEMNVGVNPASNYKSPLLYFLTFLFTPLCLISCPFSLLLQAVYADWINSETSISICIKEWYKTKGENQCHAFPNCHMVGELRAFYENIRSPILATMLNLFIKDTIICFFPQLYVVDFSLILLRTKRRHFEK